MEVLKQVSITGDAVGNTIITGDGNVVVVQSTKQVDTRFSTDDSLLVSNPYQGLAIFTEKDADRFYGRETFIENLRLAFIKLQSTQTKTMQQFRLLPVLGPSGSGKSSIIRAGLIPELARRPLPSLDNMRVAVFTPGSHPVQALARVLARVITDDPMPVKKARELENELTQLNKEDNYDGLNRIAGISASPLVVLIDQFEEVYSLCESEVERDIFITNLLIAASDPSAYVYVILTIRSDFLGHTHREPILNHIIAENGIIVPVMNKDELYRAIVEPATHSGYPIDASTVELLINQTIGHEGALPLLEFTLTRIWEGMVNGIEAADTLNHIGGVGGALAGEAQRLYQNLTNNQKIIARRCFLKLVQVSQDSSRITRRTVNITDLVAHDENIEQVREVLNKFASPNVRLITLTSDMQGAQSATVTHEALFDHWHLFNEWLEDSRDDIRLQRRLTDAVKHWQNMNKPDGLLWRSPDLDLLQDYYNHASDEMTESEVVFYFASVRKAKLTKRLKIAGVSVLVVVTLLAVTAASFGWVQLIKARIAEEDAIAQTKIAVEETRKTKQQLSHHLASEARRFVVNRPVFAGLLAVEAAKASHSAASDVAMRTMLLALNGIPLQGHTRDVRSVVISKDAKTMISASRDKTIRIWDLSQPGSKPKILQGNSGGFLCIALSDDGKTLVSGSSDGTVQVWELNQAVIQPRVLGKHNGEVMSISIDANAKTVVSGSSDKTIGIWHLQKPGEDLKKVLENRVLSVVVSQDGSTIVSGDNNGLIHIWAINKLNQEPVILKGHQGRVWDLALSDGGNVLVSGGQDATVRVWDISRPTATPRVLKSHKGPVTSVAVSADGKTVVTGSVDLSIHRWDLSQPNRKQDLLLGHEHYVLSVALSRDGTVLVSGSRDKTIRVWDLTNKKSEPRLLRDKLGAVYSTISGNGKVVATGSGSSKSVRIWDLEKNVDKPVMLKEHQAGVSSFVLNSSGKILATGSADSKIRIWNLDGSRNEPEVLTGHKGRVSSLAFSKDGKTMVSGSSDQTVRVWNLINKELPPVVLRGHDYEILSVAVSANGDKIASSSSDKINIWTFPFTKQEPIVIPVPASSVALSADGRTLASSKGEQTIKIWDLTQTTLVPINLYGNDVGVASIALSADGKVLVSGGADSGVRAWDLTRPSMQARILGKHKGGLYGWVMSVAISSDGKQAVSGGMDKVARVWQLDAGVLASKICQRTGRNMTPNEWQHYFGEQKIRTTCSQWPIEVEKQQAKMSIKDGTLTLPLSLDEFRN